MAELDITPVQGHFNTDTCRAMHDNEEDCQKLSDLAMTTFSGRLFATPVRDGMAYYIVVKENPLILRHVPYLDGYQANPALIRGLRLDDVREYQAKQTDFLA